MTEGVRTPTDPGPPLVRLAFVSSSMSGNGPRSLTRHRTFRTPGPRPRQPQTPHMSGTTGGLDVGPRHLSVMIMITGAGSRKTPQPSPFPTISTLPTNSNSTYRTIKHHTTKNPTPPYGTQTGIGTTRTLRNAPLPHLRPICPINFAFFAPAIDIINATYRVCL